MSDKLLNNILNPIRDFSPRSTSAQLEDFIKSSLYADFLSEIDLRIQDMRDSLESGSHDMFRETRGGIAALRLVAGIFKDLHNISKEEKDGR